MKRYLPIGCALLAGLVGGIVARRMASPATAGNAGGESGPVDPGGSAERSVSYDDLQKVYDRYFRPEGADVELTIRRFRDREGEATGGLAGFVAELGIRDSLIAGSGDATGIFREAMTRRDELAAMFGDDFIVELCARRAAADPVGTLQFVMDTAPRVLQLELLGRLTEIYRKVDNRELAVMCGVMHAHEDGRPQEIRDAIAEFRAGGEGSAMRKIPRWPRLTLIRLLSGYWPENSDASFFDSRDRELFGQKDPDALDAEGARDELTTICDSPGWQLRIPYLQELLRKWAIVDVHAANGYVQGLSWKGHGFLRMEKTLFGIALAKGESELAARLRKSIEEEFGEEIDAGTVAAGSVEALVPLLRGMNPGDAVRMLNDGDLSAERLSELSASDDLPESLSAAVGLALLLKTSDPESMEVGAVLEKVEEIGAQDLLPLALPAIGRRNPELALKLSLELQPDGVPQSVMVEGAAWNLYSQRGVAALDLLISEMELHPELMSGAFGSFVSRWANETPTEAAEWLAVQDLEHPIMQETLLRIVPRIAGKQPETARDLANRIVDPDARNRMISLLPADPPPGE